MSRWRTPEERIQDTRRALEQALAREERKRERRAAHQRELQERKQQRVARQRQRQHNEIFFSGGQLTYGWVEVEAPTPPLVRINKQVRDALVRYRVDRQWTYHDFAEHAQVPMQICDDIERALGRGIPSGPLLKLLAYVGGDLRR